LTFPNGGSTALAKLLLTAHSTSALNRNAEGQWLIPSLNKNVARWNKEHRVWRRKIRAVWLSEVNKNNKEPTLVIEKSPPNMCRYQELLATFSTMKTYLITFSRDPYATCASWHGRYGFERIIKNWHLSGRSPRNNENDYFRFLGEIWLERANMLLEARKDSLLDIRYEDFTDDLGTVISKLGTLIPQLKNISPAVKVKIKDYDEQTIINMNEKQIGILTANQITAISSALSSQPDTVEQFGYSIL